MQRKRNEPAGLKILFDSSRPNISLADHNAMTTEELVSYMAERSTLANNLLRVEMIQRAEAFEMNETAHIQGSLRRGPGSVVSISSYRNEA